MVFSVGQSGEMVETGRSEVTVPARHQAAAAKQNGPRAVLAGRDAKVQMCTDECDQRALSTPWASSELACNIFMVGNIARGHVRRTRQMP